MLLHAVNRGMGGSSGQILPATSSVAIVSMYVVNLSEDE